MMRTLRALVRDRTASSAAELALSLPLLFALMYGAFEMGHYSRSIHVVQKAVRDAARYAGRLPVNNFDCASGTMTDPGPVQRVARTGRPDGTVQRLQGWTADSMTSVSVTCDTSGTFTGVFEDFPDGVPVVTVNATVPYASLWGTLGFGAANLNLYARSQAAVFGA